MASRKGKKRPVRTRRVFNGFAAALTVLFPPLGVLLVWRGSWSNKAKYCMTALAVGVMALCVALLPSADNSVPGGITMVGSERKSEVYGPELPKAMVRGYTASAEGSVLAPKGDDSVVYVYASSDGKCYHEYECKFSYASSQKLTLYEAYHLGYTPCGRCNPPEYVPGS